MKLPSRSVPAIHFEQSGLTAPFANSSGLRCHGYEKRFVTFVISKATNLIMFQHETSLASAMTSLESSIRQGLNGMFDVAQERQHGLNLAAVSLVPVISKVNPRISHLFRRN